MILTSVWHQMEAVTTMQCARTRLAQECALVNRDILVMEHLVKMSMNVWLVMVDAVQMQIVQIQWEAELVNATLDIQVSKSSILCFSVFLVSSRPKLKAWIKANSDEFHASKRPRFFSRWNIIWHLIICELRKGVSFDCRKEWDRNFSFCLFTILVSNVYPSHWLSEYQVI